MSLGSSFSTMFLRLSSSCRSLNELPPLSSSLDGSAAELDSRSMAFSRRIASLLSTPLISGALASARSSSLTLLATSASRHDVDGSLASSRSSDPSM